MNMHIGTGDFVRLQKQEKTEIVRPASPYWLKRFAALYGRESHCVDGACMPMTLVMMKELRDGWEMDPRPVCFTAGSGTGLLSCMVSCSLHLEARQGEEMFVLEPDFSC